MRPDDLPAALALWQIREGIGRALVDRTLHALAAAGIGNAAIVVYAANSSDSEAKAGPAPREGPAASGPFSMADTEVGPPIVS